MRHDADVLLTTILLLSFTLPYTSSRYSGGSPQDPTQNRGRGLATYVLGNQSSLVISISIIYLLFQ
jgi:hypothetical protein